MLRRCAGLIHGGLLFSARASTIHDLASMTSAVAETVCVTATITEKKLEELRKSFKQVYYHPDGVVPKDELEQIDLWYTDWKGVPNVTSLEQIPRTTTVQLSSAGANMFLATELMKQPGATDRIKVCSSSGIHALSIPQYIISTAVQLLMKLHIQQHLVRTKAAWPERPEVLEACGEVGSQIKGNLCLYGRTVGLLGYGHIGRETARLFEAFQCRIIAANSKGDKREDNGYIIAGTGDKDGSIPEKYYSTSDPASFDEFLSQCDILVASLPSTPQTTYMLNAGHLRRMPLGSMFINVGRGDLIKSDDILEALSSTGGIMGAALDVTDPEPLTAGHPLFTHPCVIVTPHTSGSFEGYFDSGADVLLAQKKSIDAGKGPINVIDPKKGY